MLQTIRRCCGLIEGRKLIPAILFVAVLYAWVAPGFMHSLGQADHFAEVTQAPIQVANSWLHAANCTFRTGKLLVGCGEGNEVVAYATRYGADDPGHALLIGSWTLFADRPPVLSDVSRVNTVVNYVGLLALAGGLFLTRAGISASLFLLLAVPLVNASHALSPHPAQFGVACLAALPALVIFARRQGQVANPYVFGSALLVAFSALVGALLLRQAIGMMGVLAAMIAGLFWVWSARRRGESIVTPLAVAGISVALLWAPASLLKVRDLAYGLEPSANMEQHGISHALFLGLGTVENSFGIKWLDSYGVMRAKEIKPDVQYPSKEYYDIAMDLYVRTILSDPLEALRIYWKKLQKSLDVRNPSLPPVALWQMLVGAAILHVGSRWYRNKTGHVMLPGATTAVSTIFLGCFLAQAAVITPQSTYLVPAFLFAFLLFVTPLPALIAHASGGGPSAHPDNRRSRSSAGEALT